MSKHVWMVVAALAVVGCGKDDAGDTVNNGECGANERCANDVGGGGGGTDTGNPNNGGGGSDTGTADDMATGADMGTSDDMATGVDMGDIHACNRTPSGANDRRKLVVALPYTDTEYELFDLATDGTLTQTNTRFSMGRGYDGEIQFTPDGELGFARQDNGTIGAFRINSNGMPEVLNAALDPGFYVSALIIDEAGDYLYAWETGWRKTDDGTHNGALYRMAINCTTGMLEPAEEVLRSKLIRAADWRDGQLALAAVDLLDDVEPNDAHLIDLDGPTRVSSVSAFPDDDAIAAGFTVTNNGQFLLLGDNAAFSGIPNRVGVMGIQQGGQLVSTQVLDIDDPITILASPYDNAALVASGIGDELIVLGYAPENAGTPFTIRGPLSTAAPVLLPHVATMIERGDLTGFAMIAENVGIRRVQFEANGDVTDLGLLELGNGTDAIPGAIGVQP